MTCCAGTLIRLFSAPTFRHGLLFVVYVIEKASLGTYTPVGRRWNERLPTRAGRENEQSDTLAKFIYAQCVVTMNRV